MPLPPGSGHAVDCGSSPTHQKHCLTLHARHARPDPQTKKRWLRSVAVMPKRSPLRSSLRCGPVLRPCSPYARQSAVIFKAAPLPVSQRVPSVSGSPPAPRAGRVRRSGSLKITQIVQHCGGGVVTQAATLPAIAAYPRRLHLPRQLAGIRHASPIAPLPSDFGRVGGGGSLSLAREMSSRGGRASDATQRRAMAPFQVLPAIAPPPAMCSNAARLGQLCLMAARHQRGTAPLDSRRLCGAQREGSLFR